MARIPFKVRKKNRVATITWIARFTKIHRHTIARMIRDESVDLYDMESYSSFMLRHSEWFKYKIGAMSYYTHVSGIPTYFKK